MKLQEDFPSRVRELRRRSGMTQAELAKRIRVTQQAVGLWENGKVAPHGETVRKLARVFAVTADDLLGLDKGKYAKLEMRVERLERMLERFGSGGRI